ncbi:MAG: polysaccharide biosynthesis protein [Pyrinomonadaceae bacterium]|nr:polysaccharide biosynthesis protein [Sphingobacteriaceae bacterium]
MRSALLRKFHSSPTYSKLFEWGKLITFTGGAQLIVQLVGLVSGILIIRLLPTSEYALYTLANTMLGTMAVLSDGGITTGVLSQGGRVWHDKEKLGVVLATGFKLRKRFAIGGLLVASPILIYMLRDHGASWIMTILLTMSLIPAFFSDLSGSLLEVAPKLHQDIIPLQKNGLAANIGRLLLIGLTIFIFPWAFIAIFAGGIPRLIANLKLKKISSPYADWSQKSDPEIERKILDVVKRTLPSSIYYCVSGQITIWLISIFGSTEAVAQIGALGRISMMLTLFGFVFQILIIPRYARLPLDKKVILKWFVLLQFLLLIYVGAIILLATIFSSNVLWIIGKNYAGLEDLFVLSITSAVISSAAGVLYSIIISRNWIIHPAWSISIGILSQIVAICFLDLSSVRGVYYFSIINVLVGIIQSYIYVFLIIRKRQSI